MGSYGVMIESILGFDDERVLPGMLSLLSSKVKYMTKKWSRRVWGEATRYCWYRHFLLMSSTKCSILSAIFLMSILSWNYTPKHMYH